MARRTFLKRLPRKRYKHDRSLVPQPANVTIESATIQGNNRHLTLAFSSGVMVTSSTPPASLRLNGQSALAYVSTTADSVTVSVTNPLVAAQAYSIEGNDPAIRTRAGGFIEAAAGSLS